MSSLRRIQSSRANGAKSRGPVTPAGRAKSSRNNLRHGLLAEAVVLDEETSDVFFELLADLTREHNPQTETQRILVENMAVSRWRLTRLWAIERETLQAEIRKHDPQEHGPAARAALAFRALADEGPVLDLLNRYESRFDRQYARALNLLMKLGAQDSPLPQFRSAIGLPAPEGGSLASTDATPNPAPIPAESESCHSNPIPKSDTTQPSTIAGGGASVADRAEPTPAPRPTTPDPPLAPQSHQPHPASKKPPTPLSAAACIPQSPVPSARHTPGTPPPHARD